MSADRLANAARWTGVFFLLATALTRVLTSQSGIPYWDSDPFLAWAPDTSRTPAMSLLFDALAWFGVVLIILAEARAGRAIEWRSGLLALSGCVCCFLHGWVLTPLVSEGSTANVHGHFDSLIRGSAWASAIVGAWGLTIAAREPRTRTIAWSLLLGVAMILAAKGAMQVFIEHPRLVAQFQQNKDTMLAAQGFQPGSQMARLFERRLLQAEAFGWFGLSNVYGSVMAATASALLAYAIGAIRLARRGSLSVGEAGFIVIATLLASGGLMLSFSKGAIAAGLLGVGVVIAYAWSSRADNHGGGPRRLRDLLRWAPLVLPIFALATVTARGMIGERLGELSLYFRWQYLIGAARIFLANPLFGAGPGGFKDQYLLHKVPTNPEEIESPHCLPADWIATLGVFALAWIVLWCVWLWRAGTLAHAGATEVPPSGSRSPDAAPRSSAVFALCVVACATTFSFWAEWATYVPETLIIMLLAGLLWWGLARTLPRIAVLDESAVRGAMFAGTVVLSTHAMIEVSGVFTGSAAWVLACIALAGGPAPSSIASRVTPWVAASVALVVGLLVAAGSVAACSYEGALHRSASMASQVASQRRAPTADEMRAVLSTLSEAPGAFDILLPSDWQRQQVLTALKWRLALMEPAASMRSMSERLDAALEGAQAHAETVAPRSAGAWTRYARVLDARDQALQQDSSREERIRAWGYAERLDPFGLTPPTQLARLHAQAGQREDAARWARRVLELNALLRLDPLKQLTEPEREEIKALASSAAEPADPPAPTHGNGDPAP